jgi:hypothetical protein
LPVAIFQIRFHAIGVCFRACLVPKPASTFGDML